MIFPTKLTKSEIKYGLCYLAFSLLLLPSVVGLLPLGEGLQNCVYYGLNFAAVLIILRRFLASSLLIALEHPFFTFYFAALGFLGYQALGEILAVLLSAFPAFENLNNSTVSQMLLENPIPMAVSVVILVPVAEECFFRGLIFRGLFDRSPFLAYFVSMVAFAAVHVVGYVTEYTPVQLLLCFLQYLPAGYCLCYAYRRSGTIVSPIITHAIVNALGVYAAMR